MTMRAIAMFVCTPIASPSRIISANYETKPDTHASQQTLFSLLNILYKNLEMILYHCTRFQSAHDVNNSYIGCKNVPLWWHLVYIHMHDIIILQYGSVLVAVIFLSSPLAQSNSCLLLQSRSGNLLDLHVTTSHLASH